MSIQGTIIDADFDDLFSLNNNGTLIKASEDGTSSINYELPLVSPTEYASLSKHGYGYNKMTPSKSEDYKKVKDAWAPSPYNSGYTGYINSKGAMNSCSSMSLGTLAFNIIVILIIVYIVMYLYKKMSHRKY